MYILVNKLIHMDNHTFITVITCCIAKYYILYIKHINSNISHTTNIWQEKVVRAVFLDICRFKTYSGAETCFANS